MSREIYIDGVTVVEDTDAERYIDGVTVDEEQAAAPPASFPYGALKTKTKPRQWYERI